MSKISFLILHYKNINETIECIDSILNTISYINYDIVVVDNGSQNGTGEKLKQKYKNNEKVHIIISNNNLGFANGNNLGFKYCKEKLNSEYIVMINSDTVIIQGNFCQKIIEKFNEYKFHICGIDILLPDGEHTNPVESNIQNIYDIKKSIKKFKKNIIRCKANLDIITSIENRIRTKLYRNKNIKKINKDICSNKIQIHGSAIVFSKKYIEKYDGLYKGTFLYFEETAMKYISQRDNLIVLYTPEIRILHKESKSTKMLLSDRKKRHLFYYENALNSAQNLLKDIEKSKSKVWKEEENGKKYKEKLYI